MQLKKVLLDRGWSFAQAVNSDRSLESFEEVGKMPTVVHSELLRLGRIEDPYKGMNEWECQWVGEADWVFRTTFELSEEQVQKKEQGGLDLVFEGLDTFCEVFLNGKRILQSTNMFHAHRLPVGDLVRSETPNELRLEFESAWKRGKIEEEGNGGKLGLWNGDSSRLYVRKAQYHYGWDWGPVLMTAGPWKSVRLEMYDGRLADVRVDSIVEEDGSVSVHVSLGVEEGKGERVAVVLKSLSGEVVKSGSCTDGRLSWTFKKGEVDLWWPIGYGKQTLYNVEVTLHSASGILDTVVKRVGFRRARVVQDPLEGQEGRTFLFEVNGVRIFCGGSNWIPADNFLTEVTDDRYRAWLQLLVDGNQNMIRVWGGGVFEPDVFYDMCDELGILVWQDFLFGCGQYPAHDAFVESVKVEAEQAVVRLRHHPAIVIFAGNNEDYQVAEQLKLDLDYSDDQTDARTTNFPARYIYENTLPEVVERLSDIYYHRGSPYSGFGKDTTDRTVGDLHQWNVWHGSQEPWTNWDILSGRFVSEFGMEAMPNMRTVRYWLDGNSDQAYPQSKWNCQHNKADGFERRLALYLVENFKFASLTLEDYVYLTQVLQADTIAAAYRLWRREWRGRGKEYTAGALVWQINDCWPVTSWAIVDYFLRPKPAYFAVKRELASYTVGVARKEVKTYADSETAAHYTLKQEMEIWATNSTLEPIESTLEVRAFELSGAVLHEKKTDVKLAPNASTELVKGAVPGTKVLTSLAQDSSTVVVGCRLLGKDGTVLARFADWPMPFKYIVFPAPYDPIDISVDGDKVTIRSKAPVKGVVLDVEGDEVKWSDQSLDVMPGDPQIVTAAGLNGRSVLVRFYGQQ